MEFLCAKFNHVLDTGDMEPSLEKMNEELKTKLKEANCKIWQLSTELESVKELLKEERLKTKSLTSQKNELERRSNMSTGKFLDVNRFILALDIRSL